MPRRVDEWIGKDDDTDVPERVMERLWKACGGRCRGCGVNLSDQAWDVDHIIALINWIGEDHGNRESNLQVLGLKCCHRPKTREDMRLKHQTSRRIRRHTGIKRPRNPMQGSKGSKLQKRMDGSVVNRETGEIIWGRR